mmetsp:Transcript_29199/g.47137  ORF Transcript_29199/g.47137 Transcript_29199/m.47137 type:complete len:255 (+) Transcript_29199:256-1020(+)
MALPLGFLPASPTLSFASSTESGSPCTCARPANGIGEVVAVPKAQLRIPELSPRRFTVRVVMDDEQHAMPGRVTGTEVYFADCWYPEHALRVAHTILSAAQWAFFATVDSNGSPCSRLVHPSEPLPTSALHDIGPIYFGSRCDSRKVDHITLNNKVTLSYFEPDHDASVVVSGVAEIICDDLDLKRKFWREEYSKFFPGGPESPQYNLIKITAHHIEIAATRFGMPGFVRSSPAVLTRSPDLAAARSECPWLLS